MTMYTVLPVEQILAGAIQPAAASYREVNVQGMLMQVEPLEGGDARVVRLLQCPLDKYLDPAFAPGAIIRYDG
ncbi:YlzJ-like family protein [Paenibacillus tengchongensis]|uniref:YlzJ-like family protein n=1 Tax=Paenibacillus tengchongensis TaxID=2608684 RepID=UPI00124D09C3|nr:YlzJ-like family protein [Paenibacillus tengchongensis]